MRNKVIEVVNDVMTIGEGESWRGSLIRAGIFTAALILLSL